MRLVLTLLAASLVGACAAAPVSTSTQDVITHNRLAANRLAANRLAANRLAANRLAANRLNGGQLALNSSSASDLLATSDGREVLTYLISCALPPDMQLVAPDGTVFTGEIGVAPRWIDHALNPQEQRWVSACVFSRISDLDVAIPISLRGPNSALTAAPDEIADWTVQQGAFYGQLFTPSDQPILWAACSGKDAAEAVGLDRICASPDPSNPGYTLCGFVYSGECGTSAGHHHHFDIEARGSACRFFDGHGTYFDDCRVEQGWQAHDDDHGWHGGDEGGPFHEVVTVYVHP